VFTLFQIVEIVSGMKGYSCHLILTSVIVRLYASVRLWNVVRQPTSCTGISRWSNRLP